VVRAKPILYWIRNYSKAKFEYWISKYNKYNIHIDNNAIENKIRPVAIGRKNYLFAGSHNGAQRTAMFYTFFANCKLNGVNPEKWLNKVLEVIADYPCNKLQDLFPENLEV